MKTNFFKVVLSFAFIAIAVLGAFSTSAMNHKAKPLVEQTGYYPLDEEHPCGLSITCRTDGSVICKSGIFQAWGKVSPTSMNCTVQLFKKN